MMRPRELADRTNTGTRGSLAQPGPGGGGGDVKTRKAMKPRRARSQEAKSKPRSQQSRGKQSNPKPNPTLEEDEGLVQPKFVHAFGTKLGQQGSIGDAENELLKMCFDSAIVCGAAGLDSETFDDAACQMLQRAGGCDDADVVSHLVQYCLDACAKSERTSRAQAAQLHKLALMHERSARRAEVARIKTIIDALWHGHNDDTSTDMEVELFRFLKRKHAGDKPRMAAEATQIVSSMARLSAFDADIAIFFRILRNEIDQGFWKVRTRLLQTLRELSAQGMGPQEIVAHMYNDADATELLQRLEARHEPALQDVLLRFHLERHATLIAPMQTAYASLDAAERQEISFSDYVRAALVPPSSAASD
ncbi:Hypothetical Protein FCC1311_000132 [Hondaea fermentalgiana]|uniref:Uncharacterized protein n=1 Tax=Hondaea fermentalgiana TaxID=2315210 RepID=A0A2R5G5S3_9STRA|nr:Hypothetical Protein FCC1311_000132 [Hondaea fermentalgiana]|eukprot:GBG23793.1 Hypothetical Protein FCC1311_000132 [Hondaea fermentalgiana]